MKNFQFEFTLFIGTYPPSFRITTVDEGLTVIDMVQMEA